MMPNDLQNAIDIPYVEVQKIMTNAVHWLAGPATGEQSPSADEDQTSSV
jgi:hypothetical protein